MTAAVSRVRPPALGLDSGSVRVGLAASDPSGILASPLDVLPRADRGALWGRVREEAARRGARGIVVGLPRRLDGSEGAAAEAARRLADEASRETGLPVELWDERLTTVEAERAMLASGATAAARRRRVDAVAATVMLQSWLEARRNRREAR